MIEFDGFRGKGSIGPQPCSRGLHTREFEHTCKGKVCVFFCFVLCFYIPVGGVGGFFSRGESRGHCTRNKQEWSDSGSTLENILVIFTKLIPRKIFFCIAKILVLMVGSNPNQESPRQTKPKKGPK